MDFMVVDTWFDGLTEATAQCVHLFYKQAELVSIKIYDDIVNLLFFQVRMKK